MALSLLLASTLQALHPASVRMLQRTQHPAHQMLCQLHTASVQMLYCTNHPAHQMFCAYMHAAGCGRMGFLGTCMARQMMWLICRPCSSAPWFTSQLGCVATLPSKKGRVLLMGVSMSLIQINPSFNEGACEVQPVPLCMLDCHSCAACVSRSSLPYAGMTKSLPQ